MRRYYVIAVLATLLGVTFVVIDQRSPEPAVARHTVEEYRADAQLRRGVFSQCVNDPGTLAETPDCINAREAERLESRGSLRDLPPLGLDTEPRR
jgi:hypothetical protein